MKHYEFDNKKGIFKLYQPETGKDWSNHIFNDLGYIFSISQGGAAWSRYLNDDCVQVVLNHPYTSFVYLRDVESKKYWNTANYPSMNGVKGYCLEHGQQFTKISSEKYSVYSSMTYAIAKNDTREVWAVTLKNKSKRDRIIDVFATTMFDLGGYPQPPYYGCDTTNVTEYYEDINCMFNNNLNPFRPHKRTCGYIMSSETPYSYEGNFEKFIGIMGSVSRPKVLERGEDLSRSLSTVRRRGGILQNRITLKAGEEKTFYYVLGITDGVDTLKNNSKAIISECESIICDALNGENKYDNLRTNCPEPQLNNVLNFWAEHQVSYCMLGKKAVRDNAQLGMAMLNFNVPLAKKTIDECLAREYTNGRAVLTWHPYIEPKTYSDPSAWLAMAVCEYLKETGDYGYLEEVCPYLDGGYGTVKEHIFKIVEWYENKDNIGEHGLPRIHHADWNDALNIPDENAESVFMSMMIAKAYSDISDLFKFIGGAENESYANYLLERRKVICDTVNAIAWNGDYYVRAFSKFGKIGDRGDKVGGEIYINPQSWSILSEVVPEDRLEKLLASIDGMETDEGIPLCSPAYSHYDERVGRMSGMLPGVYENGGIYNHAGCFKVMADCKLHRGEHAVATLKKIVPDGLNNPSSKTTTEPYVFTNCYSKHPAVDMMVGFSWQTGTSAWGLKSYYEGILGLQRGYDGLHIDPSFPKSWKHVTAQRNYRGNRLNIEYVNEGGQNVKMFVDGKPVNGNVVPLFEDNNEHKIKVVLCR